MHIYVNFSYIIDIFLPNYGLSFMVFWSIEAGNILLLLVFYLSEDCVKSNRLVIRYGLWSDVYVCHQVFG